MSAAAEKLEALDAAMTEGRWSVWEYSDDSCYVESGSESQPGGSVKHGQFIVEIRWNAANRLDVLQSACELRNALPQLIAVARTAERLAGYKRTFRGQAVDDLYEALAALDAALGER